MAGELVVWVKALLRSGIDAQELENTPLSQMTALGALIKTRRDLERVREL